MDYYIFKKAKILFYLSIFNIIIIWIEKYYKTKVDVCLCTLGKNENKYAREFVEFYKNIGVDKIILYDNNDEDGEKFEFVIPDFINSGFVEIKNYRGRNSIQLDSINNCLKQYLRQYSWILVNDMDEFIHIKEGNIKRFLSLDRLKKCNVIHLNWRLHSDGKQLYYKNDSLFKRFPDIITRIPETVKSIIRGRKRKYINTWNHHVLRYNDNGCNAFGSIIKREDFINGIQITNPDYKDYYFDHFYTKSAEEYLAKKNKGDCFFGKHLRINMFAIDIFFALNKITLEKIQFFENTTGLNLSKFREKIKKA